MVKDAAKQVLKKTAVKKVTKTKTVTKEKTPKIKIDTQDLIATPEEQIQIDAVSKPVQEQPIKKEYVETGRGIKRRKRIGSWT